MKQDIQKNDHRTNKIFSFFLSKNGNAFYLNSTYVVSSTVWTYDGDNLEIYELSKGKVIDIFVFPDKGIFNYDIPKFDELHMEIKECGYELDGDSFGFEIKRDSEKEKQDLPINLGCFLKNKYKSDFLSKIVKDINTYKMWNVQYK